MEKTDKRLEIIRIIKETEKDPPLHIASVVMLIAIDNEFLDAEDLAVLRNRALEYFEGYTFNQFDEAVKILENRLYQLEHSTSGIDEATKELSVKLAKNAIDFITQFILATIATA